MRLFASRKRRAIHNFKSGIGVMEIVESRVLLSGEVGNIFLTSFNAGKIAEYTTTGETVNASLVSGLHGPLEAIASGSDLFVLNVSNDTIGEYTRSGKVVNASLISGLDNPLRMAVSGSNIFVAEYDYTSGMGMIGEYTISGSTVNASLISGLVGYPDIAVSGSDLFVTDSDGTIGEYTTSGDTVNASLISGQADGGIAVSNSDIFVVQYPDTIGEYTISGATVNASLVSGLNYPDGVAILGSDLFVSSDAGTVGEYTTSGATVNASLLSGLNSPKGIFVEPSQSGELPTQLAFAQQPANASAGGKLQSITIDTDDPNGALVTSGKTKITLNITSGPADGKLIGTTSAAVKNGIAMFSKLSIQKAGTYTLTASGPSIASAISTTFTITAAAAKKMAFDPQPGNASVNAPFNVSVELVDKFGNAVDDGSTVNLVLGSHPKTATNLNLSATVSDGVADFDGITLNAAGNYTLKASDGKSKATSKKFVVS